jgi:4-amino-4-deoxy-L-arabinose transferase-like glycosyltransferase
VIVSLAPTLERSAVPGWARTSARRRADRGAALDVAALGLLFLLLAAAVVWRYDAAPLQLWDESRNANNALELAQAGPPSWRWLVPTFGGVADHWNTKPPLLIWLMALGLRAGLPPLVALRLPCWAAAFATVAAVWAVLRFGLRDRLAAFAGGALITASTLYIGAHAARTGDFDALEALFVTAYVLAGWATLRDPPPRLPRLGWLALTGACVVLAVLTKGVAGLLAAPGLLVFALSRPRALMGLAADLRTWLAVTAVLTLTVGYYALREQLDGGYIAAVLGNEIGGRFMAAADNHVGAPSYYLQVLAQGFEPGLALLPTALLTLFGRDRRRSGLVAACGLSGVILLAVLSAARSKLDWYATPAVPLLATSAAVGVADLARWVAGRTRPLRRVVTAGLVLGLAGASAVAAATNQAARTTSHGDLDGPQFGYGRLFERLEASGAVRAVTAVDDGFANAAGFKAYNPVLAFYARRETARGLKVMVQPSSADLTAGQPVVSCDPSALQVLQDDYRLAVRLRVRGCVLAQVMAVNP